MTQSFLDCSDPNRTMPTLDETPSHADSRCKYRLSDRFCDGWPLENARVRAQCRMMRGPYFAAIALNLLSNCRGCPRDRYCAGIRDKISFAVVRSAWPWLIFSKMIVPFRSRMKVDGYAVSPGASQRRSYRFVST